MCVILLKFWKFPFKLVFYYDLCEFYLVAYLRVSFTPLCHSQANQWARTAVNSPNFISEGHKSESGPVEEAVSSAAVNHVSQQLLIMLALQTCYKMTACTQVLHSHAV